MVPFFTGIFSMIVFKGQEPMKPTFFVGFLVSMAGVVLISFNGSQVHVNPFGDFLSLLAAIVWGIYSILTKKIGMMGYNTIKTTRRMFFYGILWMIPIMLYEKVHISVADFIKPINLGNFLFLGIGASAICFLTWSLSVKLIGVIKTSVYIYASPVVTVVASAIILKEQITLLLVIGMVLTLVGLLVSENKIVIKRKQQEVYR